MNEIIKINKGNDLVNTLEQLATTLGEEKFLEFANNFITSFFINEKKQEEKLRIQKIKDKEKQQIEKLQKELKEKTLKDNQKFNEEVIYKHGFKVVHRTPILEPEERNKKEKELIIQLYKILKK